MLNPDDIVSSFAAAVDAFEMVVDAPIYYNIEQIRHTVVDLL